ncbi:MAG: MFS transporter [Lapillicoccus sp.]
MSSPDHLPVRPTLTLDADESHPQDRPADSPHAPFAALQHRNFRLFLSGLLVAGTGGWMQRIAQDWLVLTLTDSPIAVGITTACQFTPTILLGLHGGLLADRFPKRRLLQVTQSGMALVAAALAVLTLTGHVTAWHVYGMALVLGVLTALDNPTRQSFVTEIVGPRHIRGAISIVSSTFQIGAMVGPVVGGLLIAIVGPGWAFVVNALSFAAPLTALALIRPSELHLSKGPAGVQARVRDGLRYALDSPTVLWPVVMVATFGFFTISLPVTLAAFAKHDFGSGPSGVGLLNGAVALGALCGALFTARRSRALRLRTIATAAGLLATAQMIASLSTTQTVLMLLVVLVGATNMAFLTSAQSLVQLTAPDHLRGRVVGVYMTAFIGSGALGGPVVGFLDEHFGARFGLLVAGVVPALVTVAVARHLARRGSVRLGLTHVTVQLPRPTLVPRDH